MSLILDALRKSEAERQRGQAPDLFAVPAAAPVRPARPWKVWGGYALAGLLAVVLVFLVWRRPDPPAAPVTGEEPLVAPAETTAVNPAAGVSGPIEAAVAETTAAESATAETAVTDAVVPVHPASTGSTPPTPPPAARPALPEIADAELAALRRSATPTARPTAPASTPPAAAAVTTTDLPASPATVLRPATPSAVAAEAPDANDASDSRPPRLADLPADQRAALPPLRLSMHVYAEDPARRFVILDGRRLGEGAALAEGIQLREIRRDGLVLSVRGDDYWLER